MLRYATSAFLWGTVRVAAAILSLWPLPAHPAEDISHDGATVIHEGEGRFRVGPLKELHKPARRIDLRRIEHGYNPAVDPDVPRFTDITNGPPHPPMVDRAGRRYGWITLYQVDPPLADLPSREPGVDRSIDMRSPTDIVKSAYSNYVSPVYTDDAERRPVPNHPIGHFYVKVELGGYPTILTGMTTIRRADEELADYTLGRSLGIGGVLLTPEPGRLNAAKEVLGELALRQRRLRVIDGLHYRYGPAGTNIGPEYIVEDGNVVFARFKFPERNVKDALAMFVEYVARGEHRLFGSLINRPYKGNGAGCTPFAMSWLKAAGIIPFVAEPAATRRAIEINLPPNGVSRLWRYLLRTVNIPWAHFGCDKRLGIDRIVPADYTVYDDLFHNESTDSLIAATPGLAEKIRRGQGAVVSTLFAFGALTPLRDLFIAIKRKDPEEHGNYRWAAGDGGFKATFWDNGRFSRWIKHLWKRGQPPDGIELVKEGRFLGAVVDAMNVSRQSEPFFRAAENRASLIRAVGSRAARSKSCRELLSYGLQ